MSDNDPAAIHIHCLGCETVRVLNGTPCPGCQRCAFCGRKMKSGEACECNQVDIPAEVERLRKRRMITAEFVPREKRRDEIRKQLQFKRSLAGGTLGGLLVAAANPVKESFGLSLLNFGAVWAILFMAAVYLLRAGFRSIENRRLKAEGFAISDDAHSRHET